MSGSAFLLRGEHSGAAERKVGLQWSAGLSRERYLATLSLHLALLGRRRRERPGPGAP